MESCEVCKKRRMSHGMAPRPLQELPASITKFSQDFRRKELKIRVCPECDGEVFEKAIVLHRDERKTR